MGTLITLFLICLAIAVFGSLVLDAVFQENLFQLLEHRPFVGVVLLALIAAVVIYFFLKLSDKNKALEKRIDELALQLEQLKKKIK